MEQEINFPEISLQNADQDGQIKFSHEIEFGGVHVNIYMRTYVNKCNYVLCHFFIKEIRQNSAEVTTINFHNFETAYKIYIKSVHSYVSKHVEFAMYRRAEHLIKVWAYDEPNNPSRAEVVISGPKINKEFTLRFASWENRIKAKQFQTEMLDAYLLQCPELAFLTNTNAKQLTLF